MLSTHKQAHTHKVSVQLTVASRSWPVAKGHEAVATVLRFNWVCNCFAAWPTRSVSPSYAFESPADELNFDPTARSVQSTANNFRFHTLTDTGQRCCCFNYAWVCVRVCAFCYSRHKHSCHKPCQRPAPDRHGVYAMRPTVCNNISAFACASSYLHGTSCRMAIIGIFCSSVFLFFFSSFSLHIPLLRAATATTQVNLSGTSRKTTCTHTMQQQAPT